MKRLNPYTGEHISSAILRAFGRSLLHPLRTIGINCNGIIVKVVWTDSSSERERFYFDEVKKQSWYKP
jgi:hypothetical protein